MGSDGVCGLINLKPESPDTHLISMQCGSGITNTIENLAVKSLSHCSLSAVVPLHLLFTKKTVTKLAIHPTGTFHWFAREIVLFVSLIHMV